MSPKALISFLRNRTKYYIKQGLLPIRARQLALKDLRDASKV